MHALAGGLIVGIGAWMLGRPAEPEVAQSRPVAGSEAPATSTASATLYKWRDDRGVWNYSDKPPTDRPFERISDTPNVNSVPTVVPDFGQAEPSTPPTQ